jgi:drug/metabolite transporter (DMT)-like permease
MVAGARDTQATTAVMLVAGTLLLAPVATATWDVDGAAIPYVAASAAFELAYFTLLAAVYARADFTLAYPVARGSAPVIVLAVSVLALGAAVPAGAAAGVAAVALGVLLVRGVERVPGGGRALALALAVGACIAGYTLVDDHGVEHAGVIPYFEVVLVLITAPYVTALAAVRGRAPLRAALSVRSVVAGAAMVSAYLMALAALARADAAPVAALRETSVVIAAIGAAVAGREHVPARRVLGAVAVVAGIALIALS